ncbi:NPCBM/NEW2 domain-containing protein [Nostoc sp. FACHB-152]|uniref:NPCBM/NEW2 domain-containing protein n=1 Tax=Nostoc sp. FACHB-152 TaxID=2692837 RepID=UPI0016883703|nr:NPCBM/NEW2 domain-containing protein [Nostoc sp. FACHB-152]
MSLLDSQTENNSSSENNSNPYGGLLLSNSPFFPNSTNLLVGNSSTNQQMIAFVDANVSDAMTVMANLRADVKVLLDPTQDGITQITETLKNYKDIASIAIISHGNVAAVHLGNSILNTDSLMQYSHELQKWSASLAPDADILFYGCNVAAREFGQIFVDNLSSLTGADIAASTDLTGADSLGGDWTLEYATGSIETVNPLTDSFKSSYQGLFAPVYLSDLTPTSATNGWGAIERDRSNGEAGAGDGNNLTLNNLTYAKGLGVHAASDVTYALNGAYTTFTADIGVDDEVGANGSVIFQVWADGVQLFNSGLMTGSSTTQSINVDVTGRQTLRLVVTDGGNGADFDHANWADAQLTSLPAGPDISAPTATLVAPALATSIASPYTFNVTYSDMTAVDVSTINGSALSSDILVTGPNGFEQLAQLVSVSSNTNGTPRTATYQITAPDGIWNWNDRGTYEVTFLAGQVKDTLGNITTTNTSLGNFTVTVSSTIVLGVNSSQVTEGGSVTIPIRRVGDTTGTATINYFTGGNSTAVPNINYVPFPVSTLTFAPGESEKTVTIQTLNDGTPNTNVSVSLLIETPTGADLGPSRTSFVSIRDEATPATTFTYLSDLTPISVINGFGPIELDTSNGGAGAGDGRTITLNGFTYNKGLGVHATSEITYALNGAYNSFFAYIGVDDEVGANGSVIFQVWADGVQLFDSGVMTGGSTTKLVNVDVTGRQTLRLVVTDGGNSDAFDHADWANAQLVVGQFTPPPPADTLPIGSVNFIREQVIGALNQPTTLKWSPDGKLMFIAQKGGVVRVFVEPESPGVQFSAVQQYATGTNAHGVVASDLNGDGRLDLAVANSGSGTVSVLFGQGDGTFAAAVNYSVGSEPKSVFAADLNGDGRPDLLTANQGSSDIGVLINNGNGTFAPRVNYAAPRSAHEIMAADVDGDGDLDVAVTGWGDTIVRILRNNGSGIFASPTDYNVGVAPHTLQLADFNGDNRPDLAVGNVGSNSVSVLLNTGTGTFNAAVGYTVGFGPHSIRSADLNRDGNLDLVTANQFADSVSVLLGNGNGTFRTAVSYATGSVPKGIAIADINNDSVLDLLTANTAGNYPSSDNPGGNTISVLLGNGDGTFSTSTTYITGRTPFNLTVADFDNDGRLDVATANWHTNDVGVLLNKTNNVPLPAGLSPGLQAAPFIDISSQVNNVSDRGLLGIEVDPLFGQNQGRDFVYLLFTYDPPQTQGSSGNAATDQIGNRPARLIRVTADPATNYTTAIPGSEVILLGKNSLWQYTSRPDIDSTDNFDIPPSGIVNGSTIVAPLALIEDPDISNVGRDYTAQDTNFDNNNNIRDYLAGDSQSHSIGQIQFGSDGYLYVTIGDGTSYNGVDWRSIRVQDIDNLSGKMLRIDPITGQGLADNPFYNGDPNSNRSKVFAFGFRNAFRFTFDPNIGTPYVGDVGWNTWEEVNAIVRGGNYGWPFFEGPIQNGGYASLPQAQAFYSSGQTVVSPLLVRNHDASQNPDGKPATALIMGDFYTGNTFPSIYNRAVFYNDVGIGMIYASFLNPNGTVASTELFDNNLPYIVDMETGPDGNLYYVSLYGNEIGRWKPA